MFRHNLIMIFRSFKRDKNTFFINLIGLSTGLACTLLIFLWVNDEVNVDKFHEKDNRLFQVMLNYRRADGIQTHGRTPGLLARALSEEMPEVEYAAAVIPSGWFRSKGIISFENTQIKADEQYVSKDYFNIFSYPLLKGDINQGLLNKSSVLISDETAIKLFNTTENVVGKTIEWKRENYNLCFSGLYTILGIFKKPPANSTAQFDLIFTYELFFEKMRKNLIRWNNQNPDTYVVLKSGTDVKKFNTKIAEFIKTKSENSDNTLFVQQYSRRYLHGNYENGSPSGGRILYVNLFSIIALFILIIACINFMNLSTAKASGRIKEIGVKKVLGANRKTLIARYLSESLLMSCFSMLLAILLIELLIPQFNQITGKNLSLNIDFNLVLAVLGITFFAGFVSGIYPAFYLSGFNPAYVLKIKLKTTLGELWVRKGLVIFQFIISVILIVSMIAVYKQITFIQTKNLGFKKDNVICFKKEGKLNENLETFLYEVKKLPGIINASNSIGNFSGEHSGTTGGIIWEGKENHRKLRLVYMDVNYDFFETMGIEVLQGRTFSREFGTETSKIIFNETGIRVLGIENPIGKTVQYWGKDRQIIGVVKDFNFESLYHEVKPCFFQLFDVNFNYGDNIWVKIKSGNERESVARIQKLYKEFNPGLDFEYRFLDDDYQALYESENRISVLSWYFAGIAIIISCLGLFGLTLITAEKRTKEIGIRKVLGASVPGIIYMLSKEFLKWVVIANVIAWPVAYYAMNKWLRNFVYKIDISWWIFVLAGLLALVIALLTVSFQAVKAARANPVEALRYE